MLSFAECAEKLGHCWRTYEYYAFVGGLCKRCRHCGAIRRQEWVVSADPLTGRLSGSEPEGAAYWKARAERAEEASRMVADALQSDEYDLAAKARREGKLSE